MPQKNLATQAERNCLNGGLATNVTENKMRQWLLIGGNSHGKTVWISAGTSVRSPINDSLEYDEYVGERYIYGGKIYQLGVLRPTAKNESEIPELIAKTKLQPI